MTYFDILFIVACGSVGKIFSCITRLPHLGHRRSMSHEFRCNGHGCWNVYDAVRVDGTVKRAIKSKFVNSIRRASLRKGQPCLEFEGSGIHSCSVRVLKVPPGLTSPEQITEVPE